MSNKYKPCKIVSDKTTGKKYIYIIENGVEMPTSHDKLILLPEDFVYTLYIEPVVKQLKALGYKAKGERYLSQITGNMTTNLYIAI